MHCKAPCKEIKDDFKQKKKKSRRGDILKIKVVKKRNEKSKKKI